MNIEDEIALRNCNLVFWVEALILLLSVKTLIESPTPLTTVRRCSNAQGGGIVNKDVRWSQSLVRHCSCSRFFFHSDEGDLVAFLEIELLLLVSFSMVGLVAAATGLLLGHSILDRHKSTSSARINKYK